MKASKLVRYTCPAGRMWQACSSFPYNFCASSSMCFSLDSHSRMAWRYFAFLLSSKLTVQLARSQEKLMNGATMLKGMSFLVPSYKYTQYSTSEEVSMPVLVATKHFEGTRYLGMREKIITRINDTVQITYRWKETKPFATGRALEVFKCRFRKAASYSNMCEAGCEDVTNLTGIGDATSSACLPNEPGRWHFGVNNPYLPGLLFQELCNEFLRYN